VNGRIRLVTATVADQPGAEPEDEPLVQRAAPHFVAEASSPTHSSHHHGRQRHKRQCYLTKK